MSDSFLVFPVTGNGPATSPLEFWQMCLSLLKRKERKSISKPHLSLPVCLCAHRDTPAIFWPQRMTAGGTVIGRDQGDESGTRWKINVSSEPTLELPSDTFVLLGERQWVREHTLLGNHCRYSVICSRQPPDWRAKRKSVSDNFSGFITFFNSLLVRVIAIRFEPPETSV